MKPSRGDGFAGVLARAVAAGTMASSSGSASVAPIPRRKVRRGSDMRVIIMTAISSVWNGVLRTTPLTIDDRR